MPLLILLLNILLSSTDVQNLVCDRLAEGGCGIDDCFFHDVACEFVIGKVDEICGNVGEDLGSHFLGAFDNQVLHYVVPELTVTQRYSAFQYLLNNRLVLKLNK